MKWIKRIFGLKGSFEWAGKQMAKGHITRRKSTTGSVKYRFDKEGQQRLEWTFDLDSADAHWQNANFFWNYLSSTDWEIISR